MNSTDLNNPKFTEWNEFSRESVARVGAQSSEIYKSGLYVIRSRGNRISRVKGKSDIVYIGITGRQDGVYGRLIQHLRAVSSAGPRMARISDIFRLEFSFCPEPQPGGRTKWEAVQLEMYFKKHYELPPANHQGPRL